MLKAVLNANEILPVDYSIRKTVKVVLFNAQDQIAVFETGTLPGGGLQDDETAEEALIRECREELGMTIDQIHKICNIEQYRDYLQKHYVIEGYTAILDEIIEEPTTDDPDELKRELLWLSPRESIEFMSELLVTVSNDPNLEGDAMQGRLYNIATAKIILTQAMEEIL